MVTINQSIVPQRALRYYQQRGLITPSGCTPGGMRRYSHEDLARVAKIRQWQHPQPLPLVAPRSQAGAPGSVKAERSPMTSSLTSG